LQIIRGYARSVSRIHRHNGLDAMPQADSRIKGCLTKLHSLID